MNNDNNKVEEPKGGCMKAALLYTAIAAAVMVGFYLLFKYAGWIS